MLVSIKNFIGTKRTKRVQTWFVKVRLKELQCPAQISDLNPTEYFWDELPNVAEESENPTSTLYNLVEILPRKILFYYRVYYNEKAGTKSTVSKIIWL